MVSDLHCELVFVGLSVWSVGLGLTVLSSRKGFHSLCQASEGTANPGSFLIKFLIAVAGFDHEKSEYLALRSTRVLAYRQTLSEKTAHLEPRDGTGNFPQHSPLSGTF